MSTYYYQLRFHNEEGQYVPNPITFNKYKLRIWMPSGSPAPEDAYEFDLGFSDTNTGDLLFYRAVKITDYNDVRMSRVSNDAVLKEYTIFTGATYWSLINATYATSSGIYTFSTDPGFTVGTNLTNITLSLYPSSLGIFQPVYTFGVYSSNQLNNLPLGDYTVGIGDLGTASGTLLNDGVVYFNIETSPNAPIQSNTLSKYKVDGRLSSTYTNNPNAQTPSEAYIPSNPTQYYLYVINFSNIDPNNEITTVNIDFSYIFAFFNNSGNIISTVVQNNPCSLQLVYNASAMPADQPPPGNTQFTVVLENPNDPKSTFTFQGTSVAGADSYLVNLTHNGAALFNFFQGGAWAIRSASYNLGGSDLNINTPPNIQVVSNQLQTTLEIIPAAINLEQTYTDFTITSLIGNNPSILPNGRYEIYIGEAGPFTAYIPYSDNVLDWKFDVTIHNSIGITSFEPTNYLLSGRILDSSISNNNYTYNITFTPSPFVTSSFICYHSDTQVCCLVEGVEQFVQIGNILPGTLVKTLSHEYVPVKHIVWRRIYNDPVVSHERGKMYRSEKNALTVTSGHSILVDSLTNDQITETLKIWPSLQLIGKKYKCLAFLHSDFKPYNETGYLAIYHVILESDSPDKQYGILVQGPKENAPVWSESLSLDFFQSNNFMSIVEY
jgi:hypothetical protein